MSTRTTMVNPMPKIPSLGPDNAIDLDRLGSSDLETFIGYDGIADGDTIIVHWFGCGPNGEIVDKFSDEVDVIDDQLTPDGMPVMIENAILWLLENGLVFFAYRVRKPGSAPSDESLRLFFYVGKRPRTTSALPVLQIRESHDRHLDLDTAPSIITPWLAPYQAMRAGDVVTLHCRRFYPDGDEITPALAYPRKVVEGEQGKPLDLFLNRSDLLRVQDGKAEVYYGITYVGTDQETTYSMRQVFSLSAPTSSTLPALEIVDHDGGTLNPALFPDGLRLRIAEYPGMSGDDVLLCHASTDAAGVAPVVLHARVDASTLGKGFFELDLGADWVRATQGASLNLEHQYAWVDNARSATPYQVNVREPLNLPWVIVKDAIPDPEKPVEGEGVLNVQSLTASGITVTIPAEANYGPTAKVALHFDGFGIGGKYIATTPTPVGSRTYNIPPQYIPYNFARSVRVYYTVLQDGDPEPTPSDVFILWILPLEKHRYVAIQSAQGQANNGTIYLGRIGSSGELFTLQSWPYIRAGQTVNAILSGMDNSGNPVSVAILNNYPVTSADVTARKIEKALLLPEFQKFKPGNISVQVTIIYEEGAETRYDRTDFTLVA